MKRPVKVHRLENGELEQCTVVDPGPTRMGACIVCGAVYLQEDRLKELQMFHNLGPQKKLPAPKETFWWARVATYLRRK